MILKYIILSFLVLSSISCISQQDGLVIRIDSSKLKIDTIKVELILKNYSKKNKYFIKREIMNDVFCQNYWNFFLMQDTNDISIKCYVKTRIIKSREYSLIKPNEEVILIAEIGILPQTKIKRAATKSKYSIMVIYKDVFLKHNNAINFLQSNTVNFYY